jgi:glycosyltransferase involved in cell wall biosynthesis
VFVVTRIKTQRDIVVEALKSLKAQIYPNYEIVWIENYDKMKTIGKCFNEGVQEATGEWILFFADDDIIMPDYLATIAGGIMNNTEDVVCVSTNITMFNEQDANRQERVPTGCWKKSFLLENPFIEWANRYVDTEMFSRVAKREKKVAILKHNYGYMYRSHEGQASGMKTLVDEVGNNKHFEKVNQLMKDTFGEIE